MTTRREDESNDRHGGVDVEPSGPTVSGKASAHPIRNGPALPADWQMLHIPPNPAAV